MKGLEKIRCVISDCDGVLTDGTLLISPEGEIAKPFHVHDGSGVKLLQEGGITVCLLSGRSTASLDWRARELDVVDWFTGVDDKVRVVKEIQKKYELEPDDICYVGDDLTDLAAMNYVGFPVTVSNGRDEVKERVSYVTETPGGEGAFRELAELILKTQEKWSDIVEGYE